MSVIWDVFVEGDADEVFLKCLLKNMGVSHIRANVIGGGVTYLHAVENNIRRRRDDGSQIAILLDANSNPSNKKIEFSSRRAVEGVSSVVAALTGSVRRRGRGGWFGVAGGEQGGDGGDEDGGDDQEGAGE